MASKRLLLAVLAVVIIVIAASVTYALFYNPSPQPSALEQMALTKDDLDADWQGEIHMASNEPPTCEDFLVNDTYNANIWLVSYNNVSECKYWYDNFLNEYKSYKNWTFVNVTIGDSSFLAYYGSLERPAVDLVFIRGNIWCHVMANEYSRIGKSWWIDSTIWIAGLQLDKIDQYIAQHPGAS
jgi:hypothetical protein